MSPSSSASAAAFCLALATAFPAAAQSIVPGPGVAAAAGRYAMQPVSGGIVRLDTATGDMTFCSVESRRIDCRAPEPADASAAPAEPRADLGEAVPDDAEIDRAIGQMRGVFRAFRDIAREFEKDARDEGALAPNRT